MRKGIGRRLWAFVGVAVVLTAVLVFISGRGATARVDVADVGRQNLSAVVLSNGKVEPVMPISFRAGFSTFVDKVYAVEGQQVKRGQLLFTLDDKAVQATLSQTRADLAAQEDELSSAKSGGRADQLAKVNDDLQKGEATRDKLRRDNESLTKLVAEGAATREELDQNQLALSQAESDLKSLEKAKQSFDRQEHLDVDRIAMVVDHSRKYIAELEDQIQSAHATAPIDGTLYALPIHQGDFVTTGSLLAEMADLHHVRVRAFVDEPELGQISTGQSVEIAWDAHPDRVWTGKTEIVPEQVVARGARSVGELLCSVDNDRLDLLPNTTVDVRIQIGDQPSALVVPRGAVYIDGNRRFVYRVDGDRLHQADVKVGIANPTMIQILSGLHEGDVVALPGEADPKENLRIRAVRPE